MRVEWWGDEIESVRYLLATQRVVRELETVTVYAAREGDLAALAATSEDFPEEARRGVRVPALIVSCLSWTPYRRWGYCRTVEVWREAPQEDPGRPRGSGARALRPEDAGAGRRVHTRRGGEVVAAPPVATFADTLREAARRLDSLVEQGLAVFVACSSVGEAKRTVYAFGRYTARCARSGGWTRACRRASTRWDARWRRGSYTLTVGSRSSAAIRSSVGGARRAGVRVARSAPSRT